MSYPHFLSYVFGAYWAIDHAVMRGMMPVFHARLISGERMEAGPMTTPDNVIKTQKPKERTSYVFASGICGKHLSAMEQICAGGLSLDCLQLALKQAASEEPENIILHLNTPGGSVYGVRQTMKTIEAIRASGIRVVGYVDTMACSAGQWIIAACDAVYIDPHADLGSIGVYSALIDYSEWFKANGLKMETFVGDNAKFKAMGIDGTSLTKDQRALIQARADNLTKEFKSDMIRLRGVLPDEAMEGQAIKGQDAIEAGLADALVDSIEDVQSDLES